MNFLISLLYYHQAINIASRSALIDDAYNLARAGTLDQVLALNITQYLTAERDYVPWATAADVLGYTGLMLGKTRAFGDFQVSILKDCYLDHVKGNSLFFQATMIVKVISRQGRDFK